MSGLELRGISKRYGAVQALDDVSLSFAPGEVHAVLGENGAGKSTLVNIVCGLTPADSGTVSVGGVELPRGDAVAARRAGLGVVHQHFKLVPSFTIAENIALFRMRTAGERFDVKTLAAPAFAKARELGWAIDPTHGPAACRSACSSASRSSRASATMSRCSCSTSPPTSGPKRSAIYSEFCANSPAKVASSFLSPTSSRRC